MNVDAVIRHLESNGFAIEALARGMEASEAQWKPAEDAWSVVEVINHLCDEELLDFRMRIDLLLESPDTSWPPIQPSRWVQERAYVERALDPSLDRFLALRQQSIRWLRALQAPDWECTYIHPKLGEIRAGDLLTSWVAHDLLHLRQLDRIKYLLATQVHSAFDARYAGNW